MCRMGYADVFNKFKDDTGKIRESLIRDVRGMLCLYETAHLRVQGEDILDEALSFTITHLESVSNRVQEQVIHALNQPIRKGLTRLEATHYFFYDQDDSHNKGVKRIGLHKENAFCKRQNSGVLFLDSGKLVLFTDAIERSEIVSTDQKPCYQALLDVYNMIDEEMPRKGRLVVFGSLVLLPRILDLRSSEKLVARARVEFVSSGSSQSGFARASACIWFWT
ncbi:hypothetical protein HYC85_014697 [Camellia sinensis]|uniref:Terpene synthase N-terminal domain-containing protein n=1 Tax=Camellia sinensis TaxID=4442 RepID=A0A7J7H739_CAMSI|nr:hypothetical protein HYC85_014697 [Camellia sinensis]